MTTLKLTGVLLTCALIGSPALTAQQPSAADRAAQVLAETRKAIGGGRLETMATFSVQGRSARNMGERQMRSDIEILLAMPDKYLRTEDITAPMATTVTSGFNGETLILPSNVSFGGAGGQMIMMRMGDGGAAVGGRGGRGGGVGRGGDGGAAAATRPPMTPEQEARRTAQALRAQRAELSRQMLGWFAMAHPSLNAEYSYVGEAESPDGKADVIGVQAEGFEAQLFIDQATHLPLMVSYRGAQPRIVTTRGPATPSPAAQGVEQMERGGDAGRSPQPQPQVEHRVYFSDWRDADGIKFPFAMQRAVAGETMEEWEITKVKVNPKIDVKKFQ